MWNPFKLITWKKFDGYLFKLYKLGLNLSGEASDTIDYVSPTFQYYADRNLLTNTAFKKGLCYVYYLFGTGLGQTFKKYFRKLKKPYLWRKEQRIYYKELPDKITLFRGISFEEKEDAGIKHDGITLAHASKLGISWTPIMEKANYHAIPNGYVVQTTVEKKRLKALFITNNNLYQRVEAILILKDTDNVVIIRDKKKENEQALKDYL